MRELIMLIAHRTATELMNPRLKSLGPYDRVKFFISTAITASIVSIVLIVNTFFIQEKIHLSGGVIVVFPLLFLVNYFLVGLIFKRSMLARSIRLYKGSKLARVGGAIGLFYLLLNLAVFILTLVLSRKFT
jgi:hypothetical protein